METVRDFIFLGSKITADGDCSHEIKRYLLLGRKAMTNLDSLLHSSVSTGILKCGPYDGPEFLLCDAPPHRQAYGSTLKKAASSTEAGPPTPRADAQKLSHVIARLGETGDPQVQTLGSAHH